MKTFTLKLITPWGVAYEGEISQALLPTPSGQITVLPNHTALISLLSPGEIIIRNSGKEHYLATEGGVVEIADNLVRILADTAESAESIDEAKVLEARKKAQKMRADAKDKVAFSNAEVLLEKQIVKIRVLKRRKKYR